MKSIKIHIKNINKFSVVITFQLLFAVIGYIIFESHVPHDKLLTDLVNIYLILYIMGIFIAGICWIGYRPDKITEISISFNRLSFSVVLHGIILLTVIYIYDLYLVIFYETPIYWKYMINLYTTLFFNNLLLTTALIIFIIYNLWLKIKIPSHTIVAVIWMIIVTICIFVYFNHYIHI